MEVVDAVVLTHFHADHVDGLPGVLRDRIVTSDPHVSRARTCLSGPRSAGLGSRGAASRLQPLYPGDQLRWGSVGASVLWPARVLHEGSVPNNASVVLSVDISGLRVLMLGDVEVDAARQVLLALRRDQAYGENDGYDVLKVAHHGSRLQDPTLLAEVRRRWH